MGPFQALRDLQVHVGVDLEGLAGESPEDLVSSRGARRSTAVPLWSTLLDLGGPSHAHAFG